MYSHQISEMLEALQTVGVVEETNYEKAQSALKEYWSDKMATTWTTNDIYTLLFEPEDSPFNLYCYLDRILPKEKAKVILTKVLDNMDADHGITWESFRDEADDQGFDFYTRESIVESETTVRQWLALQQTKHTMSFDLFKDQEDRRAKIKHHLLRPGTNPVIIALLR